MNFETQKFDDSLYHHGFNLVPRNDSTPKINMRKFDGNGPITWILQTEQFCDLHQVPTLQKVTIASLYLEPENFVWYQWIYERKKNSIISWSIFTE